MTKVCRLCEVEKPTSEFYKDKSKKDGLGSYCLPCRKKKSRQWEQENRDRKNASVRAHRAANPERTKELSRQQREKSREKLRAYGRARYAANRERLLEQTRAWKRDNPEKSAEYPRRWRQNNPLKHTARQSARRALKLATAVGPVDYEAILERFGDVCHICSGEIDRDASFPAPLSLSFDHVVPLARGGAHTEANIRPSHLRCNMSKGAKVA